MYPLTPLAQLRPHLILKQTPVRDARDKPIDVASGNQLNPRSEVAAGAPDRLRADGVVIPLPCVADADVRVRARGGSAATEHLCPGNSEQSYDLIARAPAWALGAAAMLF